MKVFKIGVARAIALLFIGLIFVVADDSYDKKDGGLGSGRRIGDGELNGEGGQSNGLIIEPEDYSNILFNQAMDILKTIPDPRARPLNGNSKYSSHSILTSSDIPLPLRVKSGPSQIRRLLLEKLQFPKEKVRKYLSKLLGPTLQEQVAFEENLLSNKNEIKRKLDESVKLLEKSSSIGSDDALYVLADMYLYGNYTCERNFSKAIEYYEKLADNGNATAQFMSGLAYSTGLFGTIPVDQAKASLYYTFAAYGGDVRGKMAMGFRHLASIAGPINFEAAYGFYRSAADKSLEYYLNGGDPLARRYLGRNSFIIADEFVGGIYGQGASEVSSGNGPLRKTRKKQLGFGSIDGVLELYDEFISDESVIVQFALAVLFYEGGIYSEPDYKRSVAHALRGASQAWDLSSGQPSNNLDKESIYFASRCAGFIGQRYLRGEGVDQNTSKALDWFRKGVAYDDPNSHDGLGLMYLRGIEVPQDIELAISHLQAAADKKVTNSQMNLARIYKSKGDRNKEFEYIKSAAQGNNLEAMYILADDLVKIQKEQENNEPRIYEEAVFRLKQLSERVEDYHSPLRWAQQMYKEGDIISALLGFLIAAEEGYESAQVNVAYILDGSPGYIDITKLIEDDGLKESIKSTSSSSSLVYWTRASKQINADAQVKMGDYYLKGSGTEANPEKAAACYAEASERGHGMASWNLGWMHENGIGHEHDYHLAKRYYDHALVSSPEAYLPVKLSLLQLHIKGYWNTLTGGKIRDIIPESKPKLTVKEHWEIFWNRWKEMKFKLWDDEEEYEVDVEWVELQGDLLETMIIIGVFSLISLVLWWRQRRQVVVGGVQQEQRVGVQERVQPEQRVVDPEHVTQPPPPPPTQPQDEPPLNRPFGPHLIQPDENPFIPIS